MRIETEETPPKNQKLGYYMEWGTENWNEKNTEQRLNQVWNVGGTGQGTCDKSTSYLSSILNSRFSAW